MSRLGRDAQPSGGPARSVRMLVWASTLVLPSGTVRDRYRREHHGELAALPPGRQLRYLLGALCTAWAIRRAVAPSQGRPVRGNLMKYFLALVAVALGAAAVILGEADDSPGLQLLGVLFVIGGITLGVRTRRRSSAVGQ